MSRAKLNGADLREAQLGPLVIGKDRLMPCDLTRAMIKSADLRGADLRHTVLAHADLSRSDLTGAHLRDTNLTDAVTSGVKGLEIKL
jgi:uncharacterized protein YjbI with pentapeptide repeats